MAAVNLDIFVSDIAAALGSFDVIRVERSVTVESGPYEEITAAAVDSASLLGTVTGNYNISGQTLSLLIDSLPQLDVVFTGTDPLTTAQVVDQINTAAGDTIAADVANAVELTSTLTGSVSKMEIVGGSAAPTLGFTPGDRDVGKEAYIPLVAGVQNYSFTDNDGQAGYFYRVRFFSTTTNLLSEYSAPFQGAPGTQISAGNLSVGSIDLVDQQGVAVTGQKITFFALHSALEVEGFAVAIQRKGITIETDNAGHAEITLVRGLEARVVFEGTTLIKDITVPDAASFDILQLVGAAPDIFSAAVPNLPAAPRRTT